MSLTQIEPDLYRAESYPIDVDSIDRLPAIVIVDGENHGITVVQED